MAIFINVSLANIWKGKMVRELSLIFLFKLSLFRGLFLVAHGVCFGKFYFFWIF